MKRLSPQEELEHLKEIVGSDNYEGIFNQQIAAFNTLQARSHVLLSLVTICLTITGFSGPRIAESGAISKTMLIIGLCFVLATAVWLLLGTFDLQWVFRCKMGSKDDTICYVIERRNKRTRNYRVAMLFLVIGLSSYVASVVAFMLGLST